MKFIVSKEEGLLEVAASILNHFKNENCFAFYGEMGAGKTTFTKAFCKALNVVDAISSPTFSIVNEYASADDLVIYHFDFYRLDHQEEALDIGWETYLEQGDYCFLEWPEKIENLLPNRFVKILILVEGEERHISASLVGE